jgi:hypothetical protein
VLGLQRRAKLVQVDAQVLAMGADRQAACSQERTGGAAPTATQARQTVAHNTPTAALEVATSSRWPPP